MSTHLGPASEQAPQAIVPVRPATSPQTAPTAGTPAGLLRRTLGVRVPSRRTLGSRVPSRRTLGFKDHSRRTLAYKSQSRRTLWGRRGGSQRILS